MTASMVVTCPLCAMRFRVAAEHAGRAVRCPAPTCARVMRVGTHTPPPPPPPPTPQRPPAWQGVIPFAVAALLVCVTVAAGMAFLPSREKPEPRAKAENVKKPLLIAVDGGGSMPRPDELTAAAAPPTPPTYEKDILPLFEKYCLKCHSTEKKRGGIILDKQKDDAAIKKALVLWEKAGDALRNNEMPPEGQKKPTPAEMETINAWLEATVFKLDCSGPKDPGRVTIRRLNRAEYNNTVRDLTGVDFKPARDFPADDVGYGFDNIGDVLSLPPLLMEKYLAAAEKIADEVIKKPELRKRIVDRKLPGDMGPMAAVIKPFMAKAWRRPVTDEEVKRVVFLARVSRDLGEEPLAGVRLMIQGVLISPHFLFRIEKERPGIQPVSDHELATRLSYFLWSSLPDDELREKADKGELRKPGVLEAQARRMLKDAKAVALADNFAAQWLNLRSLPSFSPDPKRFPTVSSALKDAMMRETNEFFQFVMKEDRSVLDFLQADYTFVNESLAAHYGLKDVKGGEFRKVSLAGTQRGGVLTHASVLSVTSNPTRTSPVKRGKWVLDNILGTPPPPPPPDVPELEQKGELKGSLREQMEQHRKDPGCASCHARMDPLGFGYENFDAVGRWRDKDGKFAIDPSGVLPDGSKFKGPAELKTILLARKEQFVRCLTDKMLTYALGRGTERSDRCYIDEIARAVAKNDHKFSELVIRIIHSEPFQKRRGKEMAK